MKPHTQRNRRLVCVLLAATLAGCGTAPQRQVPPPGLPAVPLAVPARALNPDVRPDTIQQTICTAGYAASVRPSTIYTKGVKLKLLREANLPADRAQAFELDHRVALAVGGHPRALENLALQLWEGDAGAKRKDRLERRLQQLVCAGRLPLEQAQRALYFDWKAAYGEFIPSP